MNLSDEQNRTIRAMQLLGFTFPPDLERSAKTIKELPFEYMLRIRAMYREQYDIYNRVFDDLRDRAIHCYCHICDREEWSYDDIPEEWGWYDAQVGWYLMCDECQLRYAEKFNQIPEVVREI